MKDNAESRELIVEAADRLFYSHGIQAVTMAQIKAEASVSLKRLYATFPSKDDVVLAVLDHRRKTWEAAVARATEPAPTPRDKILAIYDFLFEWFRQDDYRGCGFINAFGELGATFPDVATAVREHKQAFERLMADLVERAGGDEALGIQLTILAEGAQSMSAICGDPEVARHARAAAVVLIDQAIRL